MNKIKVLSVFGTRPKAIKMAPLVKAMQNNDKIESIICVTAQHREMLDSVMDIFKIKSNYDLNIMSHGQTIVDISNKVLSGVANIHFAPTKLNYENLIAESINDKELYISMSKSNNPYGDGKSSDRIIEYIIKYFEKIN